MFRLRRSPIGTERQRVVIDTDPGNEIDDQFAIVHALLAADVLDVEALYAAPFTNDRATGPAEGVEQGYAEIRRLLDLLGTAARGPNPPLAQVADTVDRVRVHRGSESYLDGVTRPVESAAALDLVERGMAGQGARLTVIALAALTDVASAFLLEPRLSGRVLVVWLGGQPREAPSAEEFNLSQDPEAVRVVLNSGVPFVHIPCRGVASHLATTVPEVEHYVRPCGDVGAYLTDLFSGYRHFVPGTAKIIWDIAAVGYVIEQEWLTTRVIPSPVLGRDLRWTSMPGRHSIRQATYVDRDQIYGDLFTRLGRLRGSGSTPA